MIEIRPPSPQEKADWFALWRGYLSFYGAELPDEITELTWQRLHDEIEPIHALAAYDAGTMIGIAHYLFHRSSWAKESYCYLEDLFVSTEARGKGAARTLIEAVRDEAVQAGASRLYWATQETNARAQTLYRKLATRTDFVQYRMPLGPARN